MLTFITRSGEDGQLRENSRLPKTIQVTDTGHLYIGDSYSTDW